MTDQTPPAPDRIAVVDDDPEIRALLTQYLEGNGMEVFAADGGDALDEILAREQVDLILLDVMMPGRDGVEICRNLRANSWVPIILVTAKDSDIDRILGIEVGADDYITKPFNPRELLARIKAVLRRSRAPSLRVESVTPQAAAPNLARGAGYAISDGYLDLDSCLFVDGENALVELTAAEFDLLHALTLSAGRAVTRGHLLSMTHGPVSDSYERSIDVLVSRLRTKLEGSSGDLGTIKTVRGVGYLLNAAVRHRPDGR